MAWFCPENDDAADAEARDVMIAELFGTSESVTVTPVEDDD